MMIGSLLPLTWEDLAAIIFTIVKG